MLSLRQYASSRLVSSGRAAALNQHARVSRTFGVQRWQSTEAHDGPPVTETNLAEVTMKRFWTTVGIDKRGDKLAVKLDHRTLKTPSGNPVVVPESKKLLATLIAAEWDHQTNVIKPHALPVTSLASRAIDAMVDKTTRSEVREALLKYLDTDTVCFYEDITPQIERLQADHWDPLFVWVEKTFGVKLLKHESIFSSKQPAETRKKLGDVIENFDQWQLSAFERATYTTKSFIIALALVLRHLTPEQAALAACVEVNSQIERWGEVEDTHDVEYHEVRRQLASAASLLSNS